jgi:four helix bundle protein
MLRSLEGRLGVEKFRGCEDTRGMNPRHEYSFEKLRAWQSARELAKAVYATTAIFPHREVYGLTSQCNRAAISVAANLAEGSSRQSPKDQAHFSEIAYGSLMELACLLILSTDVGVLAIEAELKLRQSIEKVSAQVNALRRSQRSRQT